MWEVNKNLINAEKISHSSQHSHSKNMETIYRKIPKISPRGLYFSKALFEGLSFGGAYIHRGLSTEGNLRFKIDWANLIVGSEFTVFASFYFVFEGNFPSTSPWGAYIILEGRFNGGFFALPVWSTYIWRGLYMEGLIFGILRIYSIRMSHALTVYISSSSSQFKEA